MLRSFCSDRRGNFALTSAVAMLPIIGLAGAALDYSRIRQFRAGTQDALDATVLAMMVNGTTTSDAKNLSGQSFFRGQPDNPCSTTPRFTYNATLTEVTGTVRCEMSTAFLGLVGTTSVTVNVESRAILGQKQGAACVVALDRTARGSVSIGGSGSIEVPNCGVYVNSNDSQALQITGSGTLAAQRSWVGGGYTGTPTPPPTTGVPPVDDPFAGTPEPAPASMTCTYKSQLVTTGNGRNAVTTMQPVVFSTPTVFPANTVFCGDITFNADVTFQPGIHYFYPYELYGALILGTKSYVKIGPNMKFTSLGSMLYFGPNVLFDKTTGDGQVNLTPMSSGPYKGVAIFASRYTARNSPFVMRGTPNFVIAGSIYTPTMAYDMSGDSSITTTARSGYVIANRFSYTGNATLSMQAFGGITPWSTSEEYVRLTR